MKLTAKEAVCQYQGWDYDDLKENRYQGGRTTSPVYSTANGLVCAVGNGKKPPKVDFVEWEEAVGNSAEFCKQNGFTVFISKEN